MTKKPQQKFDWTKIELEIVLGVALALLIWGAYAYLPKKDGIKPLAQGRQTYFVSSSEPGPKLTEVTIDPFDPKVGKEQTVSVSANYSFPIKKVLVTMRTDHGLSAPYVLNRVEGSATNGRWESAWKVPDSHDYIYGAIIEAIAENDGYAKAELTLR